SCRQIARIPTPWAFRYRIVVHASTPSTPSGPPHGRWSMRARLPERLGLGSGDGWVLFPAKSTAGQWPLPVGSLVLTCPADAAQPAALDGQQVGPWLVSLG